MQNVVLKENVAKIGNYITLENTSSYGVFGFELPLSGSEVVEAEIKKAIDTAATSYMFGTLDVGQKTLVAVVVTAAGIELSNELQNEAGNKCQELWAYMQSPAATVQVPAPAPAASVSSPVPAVQKPAPIDPHQIVQSKVTEFKINGKRPTPSDLFMTARSAYMLYWKAYLEAVMGKPINMLAKKDWEAAGAPPWELNLSDMSKYMEAFADTKAPTTQTLTPQAPTNVPPFLQQPVTQAAPPQQPPTAQSPVVQPPAAQPPADQPQATPPAEGATPADSKPKRTRKPKAPAAPGAQTTPPLPVPEVPGSVTYKYLIKVNGRAFGGGDSAVFSKKEDAEAVGAEKAAQLKQLFPDIAPVVELVESKMLVSLIRFTPLDGTIPAFEMTGDGITIGKMIIAELQKRPIHMFGSPVAAWGVPAHKKDVIAELLKVYPDEVFVKKLAAFLLP